jgi:hypothetical protein
MSLDTLLDMIESEDNAEELLTRLSQISKVTPGKPQVLPRNILEINAVTLVTPVTPKNTLPVKEITPEQERECNKRRQKVLSMLAGNLDKQRVYITDTSTDPDNVILTVAIRGLATFEMLIPRYRYDPFLFAEMIDEKLPQ